MRIGIVPADARQQAVGEAFAREGWSVRWVGSPEEISDELLLLPMPVSQDGLRLYGSETALVDWFAALTGKTIFGGRCSDAVNKLAAEYNVRILDHFERQEEVILNVIPTVEGALQVAMEQTDFTLHGSRVLVCGFGRIGKLLSRSLAALGARVCVSARKPSDLAWCQALGYQWVHTANIQEILPLQQIVFNTVPALIFDRKMLKTMNKETLLIDLASAPGGVDFAYAAQMGKRVLQALALPSKVAPRTAGEIICKTIMNMYQEEENTRVR